MCVCVYKVLPFSLAHMLWSQTGGQLGYMSLQLSLKVFGWFLRIFLCYLTEIGGLTIKLRG